MVPTKTPTPPPEVDPLLAPLLNVNLSLQKAETAAAEGPKDQGLSLLQIVEESNPHQTKKTLESELIASNFEEKERREKELREQHKKQQIEAEHFQRVLGAAYGSSGAGMPLATATAGMLPMAPGITATGGLMGASPYMSSTALPSVFVTTVAGPDGQAIPMMFTGLPMMYSVGNMPAAGAPGAVAVGTGAASPAVPLSTGVVQPASTPLSAIAIEANRAALEQQQQKQLDASKFDFIAAAIKDAKAT